MIHDLLARTQSELSTLAVTGLANAGPALAELNILADELAAARLGKLGERLQAIGQGGDDRESTAAWAAAWAGVGLVRTRLLKPQVLDLGDVLALPQAPNIVFPRPAGDLDSVDGLLCVLQGPDAMARAYAAGRLAEFGDEAVPGLLAVQRTCGRCIRFLAIEALARIGSDSALAGLVGLLGDGDVARPLEVALLGLGERAVEPVAEALAQAKDKKPRQAAAKLLWRLRPAERLRPSLDDGDELVQAYAQAALWPNSRLAERAEQQSSAAGIPAAVALFERDLMTVDSLVERLDALAKNRLADAAAVLRHTPAEPPLLAHYLAQISDGRRSKDRERASALVAYLANPAALGALLRVSEQNTSLVVDALAELGDSTATRPLIRYAEQSTGFWESKIIPALGRIGDPAAVPFLLQILAATSHQTIREAIEKAMLAIGTPMVEAVSQALLHLSPTEQGAAPTLERILAKIKTSEAKKTLQVYRDGTDELTRLLRYLADSKEAKRAIVAVAQLGPEAWKPLLRMVTSDTSVESKKNAALALAKLGPVLSEEQRQHTISTLIDQLRAQPLRSGPGLVPGFIVNPLASNLVRALCELDAESAAPEIRSALVIAEVGQGLVDRWQKTRQPWLLAVIVQGLQAPDTRIHTLQIIQQKTTDQEIQRQLWPAVEAIVQHETSAYTLQEVVACLRAWADPRSVPLLQGLKKRWATVSSPSWWKDRLGKELDEALTELNKKRSLKDRLLGR